MNRRIVRLVGRLVSVGLLSLSQAYAASGKVVRVSVIEPVPPPDPTFLTVAPISQSQIDLVWQDNGNNEDGTEIERCTGARAFCDANPASFAGIGQVVADVASYSDTGLDANTTYTYRVRAFNSAGYSGYSNTADAIAPVLNSPAMPSDLTVVGALPSEVDLNWVDNSDNEDGFIIERCSPGESGCGDEEWEFHFIGAGVVDANTTTFTDREVTPSTMYEYRVKAFNAYGDSPYSNVVLFWTPPPPPPPAAPSNLSVIAVSTIQIDLTWTDNSDNEDGFWIYRCSGSASICAHGDFGRIGEVGPNMTRYENTGLNPNTTYSYLVYAFNSGGSSSSNMAEATTFGPPSAPTNLSATTDHKGSGVWVDLAWADNSNNEEIFRIERCTGSGCTNFALLANKAAGQTTHRDTAVARRTTYRYRVRAENSYGSSTWSDVVTTTTP